MTRLSVILSSAALALATTAAQAQKVGDTVNLSALQKAEWVQGEAPAEWEPGKLYILECWATWCGPCIAAIPHVDGLYDKYRDQGLRVLGMDVWEDGKDKVVEFVKKKGDGMSYPVAYTGKGSPFENEWLKVAEVAGIPHAFLVKDGKVLAMSHPAQITEELVETLLKGGEAQTAMLAKMNEAAAKQQGINKAKAAWQKAFQTKDPVAMNAAADQLEAASPGDMYVPLFRNEAMIAAKDWAGLEKSVASLDESNKMRPLILSAMSGTIARTEGVPAETTLKVIAAYQSVVAANEKASPTDALNISRLYWQAGDKEKATAEAKKAIDMAKAGKSPVQMPLAPLERFAAAVEGGTMPSFEDFANWVKETRAAGAAEAPAAH